jgi:membrane dipeptidase
MTRVESLKTFVTLFLLTVAGVSTAFFGCRDVWAQKPELTVSPNAIEVHQASMLFDGHNDLPWTLRMRGGDFDKVDIAARTPFHTDIPRLKQGGVKAQFWSVWVPASTDRTGNALLQTLEQIDLVHAMCQRYPDTFEFAGTADDVERIVKSGKIASLIGVEGGHSIQNSLQVLRQLYDRGARYMTLTHSKTLGWADSATDDAKNNGLSPFGKEVVSEMNRIGMLVDLSHVSEKCMADALDVARAPVIFSHSSARAICDHPRNVPDAILERMKENGGVVMVNFMSGYVVPTSELEENRRARGNYKTVCDHIDHIAKVAGIDHVGIGSDFDGVSRLPIGLDDVSCYPNITQELLNRGYSLGDIHKILGGNVLRVFRATEEVAASLAQPPASAQEGTSLFTVEVTGPETNRSDVIVQVPLNRQMDQQVVTLRDGQGITMLGQISGPSIAVERDEASQFLSFVLPEMKAGSNLTLKAYPQGLNPYRRFEWHDDGSTSAELQFGSQPVLKYMYEALDDSTARRRGETYKVYHHVYTPDGSRLMTKGPGGLFPHHRGLFYGFNRIAYGENQKADIWHCKNGESQSHEAAVAQVGGPVLGRDVNKIFWRGQDGKPFAVELREMTVFKIDGDSLIEFNSLLETVAGPIVLKGDPQHAGFQFRAAQDVPDKTKAMTYYLRPDGKDVPGSFRNWSDKPNETKVNRNHVNLDWNAMSIVLPVRQRQRGTRDEPREVNQRFTVAYLDHPDNPRPARYSERDYGRFGCYFEYTLTKENPLRLRYRIWIRRGELSVEAVNAADDAFEQPVEATISFPEVGPQG